MMEQYLKTVEALQQQFEALAETRSFLLEQAITDVEQGQWSPDYVQSIQPFYSELVDKKSKFNTLLCSPDDSEDECVLVIEHQSKPEYIVEFLGGEVQYESLYFYRDNTVTRCHLYKNAELVTPISIEQLQLDDDGLPLLFTEYRDGASRQIHYKWDNDQVTTQSQYLHDGQLVDYEAFTIELSEGSVATIIDSKTGASAYSAKQAQASIEDLLDDYQEVIYQLMIEGLQKQPPEGEGIIGMVLEFFPERPFPPSIGLTTKADRNSASDEYPLGWLNAAELEDFYECEFFYEDRNDETLNAKLEALGFDETVRLSEAWYQSLCKRISESKEIKSLVNANDYFFATAHDYTSGTDLEILENYLQPELFQSIKADLEKFTESYQEKVDNNPFVIKANTFKQSVYDRLADIKTQHSQTNFEQRYSLSGSYSIDPLAWALNDNKRQFSLDNLILRPMAPVATEYYVYDILDGQVHAITNIQDGKPVSRIHLIYDTEATEQISIDLEATDEHPNGSMNEYLRVEHGNGQKQRCYSLNRYFLDLEEFTTNDAGQIVKITRSKHFLEHALDRTSSDIEVSYTESGELEQMIHHLSDNDRHALYNRADRQRGQAQEDYAKILSGQLIRFITQQPTQTLSLRFIPQGEQPSLFVVLADQENATEFLSANRGDLEDAGAAIAESLEVLSERYDHIQSIVSSFLPDVARSLMECVSLFVFEKTGVWITMELGHAFELREAKDQSPATIN